MLAGFFLLANALGLVAAVNLQGSPAVQEASTAYQSPAAGLQVFLIIGVATVLLLALYRFDAGLLVRLWFGLALLLTTFIFFDALLAPLPALGATALALGLRYRTANPMRRNLLDAVSFAGAGALFGSLLSLPAAAVLYGLLSVYDYVAVNLSGHMVTLAKEGAASGTFMGFQTPTPDGTEVDLERRAAGDATGEGRRAGVLGGGDVIVPMIFAVALLSRFGPGAAVAAMLGSAAALHLFFVRLSGEKFYPAIPVVGAGSLVGLAAWLLISPLV